MNFEAVETSSELFLGFLWSILRMNHEKHMLKIDIKSEGQNLLARLPLSPKNHKSKVEMS